MDYRKTGIMVGETLLTTAGVAAIVNCAETETVEPEENTPAENTPAEVITLQEQVSENAAAAFEEAESIWADMPTSNGNAILERILRPETGHIATLNNYETQLAGNNLVQAAQAYGQLLDKVQTDIEALAAPQDGVYNHGAVLAVLMDYNKLTLNYENINRLNGVVNTEGQALVTQEMQAQRQYIDSIMEEFMKIADDMGVKFYAVGKEGTDEAQPLDQQVMDAFFGNATWDDLENAVGNPHSAYEVLMRAVRNAFNGNVEFDAANVADEGDGPSQLWYNLPESARLGDGAYDSGERKFMNGTNPVDTGLGPMILSTNGGLPTVNTTTQEGGFVMHGDDVDVSEFIEYFDNDASTQIVGAAYTPVFPTEYKNEAVRDAIQAKIDEYHSE